MSDIEDRAKRIVGALCARPDIYYEVMREVQKHRVVSPWFEKEEWMSPDVMHIRHRRRSEHGGLDVVVADTRDGTYSWRIICSGEGPKHGKCKSVEEGKRIVDAYLRAQGVLLAGEVWE